MKLYSSALDVLAALLAVTAVTAFVPNSHRTNPKQVRTQILPISSTACSATQSSESESSPRFPFNDKQVRFAYDEWRLIYGKGDFDSDRFEQFKRNHRTVTVSNLNAREKAAREGRPKPQWMSLNEYGDYSMEEYEAMLQGEQPAVNGDNSKANSSLSEARDQAAPVTQQTLKHGQYRPTFLVGNDYAANTGQVQEYQDQFGRPIHSESTKSNNYANNIDEEDGESSSSGMRGTLIIPKGEGSKDRKRGTQIIKNSSSARGTQIIKNSSSARGTQVINPSSSVRGTQVVNPSPVRGTEVINPAPSVRGTHVVQPIRAGISARSGTQVVAKSLNDVSNSSYGTQVINQSRGTQVVRSSNNQMNTSESYGTQVIKYANVGGDDGRGVQASQSSFDSDIREDEYSSTSTPGGTQIIPRGGNDGKGSGPREGGTLVVSKDDKETWSDIVGKIFSESEKDEDDVDDNALVAPRGTRVIKRSIEVAEPKTLKNPFNFFGSGGTEKEKKSDNDDPVQGEQPSVGNSFFNFGSSGTEKENANAVNEEPAQEEEPSGGNSFFNFGSSGTEKEKKNVFKEEEPVREEQPSSGNSFFNFGSSGTEKEKKSVVKKEEEEPVQEKEPSGVNSFFNFGSIATEKEKKNVVKEEELVQEEEPSSGNSFFNFGSIGTEKEKNNEVKEEEPVQEEPSDGNSFFNFMSPKDKSAAKENVEVGIEEQVDAEKEDKSGGGIFSFFGGNVKSANPRTVRTTITLQKTTPSAKKLQGTKARRQTKLIPENQSEDGVPSILSFFGGAKKVTEEETARDPNSRPTLIVNKPQKNQFWSAFSTKKKSDKAPDEATASSPKIKNDVIAKRIAKQREGVERAARRKIEVAKERETKRLELQEKRLEATRRRETQARQSAGKATSTQSITPMASKSSSPFQFFGAVGRQSTQPTLKKWKQNRDGTISGLIYDSKNFKDGTRITTSPIPRGAKGGTVVKTAGGSKYSLT